MPPYERGTPVKRDTTVAGGLHVSKGCLAAYACEAVRPPSITSLPYGRGTLLIRYLSVFLLMGEVPLLSVTSPFFSVWARYPCNLLPLHFPPCGPGTRVIRYLSAVLWEPQQQQSGGECEHVCRTH